MGIEKGFVCFLVFFEGKVCDFVLGVIDIVCRIKIVLVFMVYSELDKWVDIFSGICRLLG